MIKPKLKIVMESSKDKHTSFEDPEWQKGEQEAQKDIDAGKVVEIQDIDHFFDTLEKTGEVQRSP